jgi:RHS repeat-associated protein
VTDALGSTQALTSSSGSITTSYTYEPFGNVTVTNPAPTDANPYQFTGRENDGAGLYYYRARYYSPTFHGFVAQDPLGFASKEINLYMYANGNPVSLSDATGLETGYVSLKSSPPYAMTRIPFEMPPLTPCDGTLLCYICSTGLCLGSPVPGTELPCAASLGLACPNKCGGLPSLPKPPKFPPLFPPGGGPPGVPVVQ